LCERGDASVIDRRFTGEGETEEEMWRNGAGATGNRQQAIIKP
jgi:hypothetical protein